MSEYKYEIKEDKEDKGEAVIKKSKITVEFTLNQLKEEKKRIEKVLEETKAQYEVDSAARTNIETNHPYVLEVDDEEVKKSHAITLHREYDRKCLASQLKINQIEKIFKEHDGELADIEKQTGLVLKEAKKKTKKDDK